MLTKRSRKILLACLVCFAVLVASLLVPLFSAAGKPLCLFLYENLAAGQMVERYAVMLFPMTLSMMTTSILNSMGLEKYTLSIFLASGALTLGAVVVLPPLLGVEALPVGYALSFLFSAVGNLMLLRKKLPVQEGLPKFVFRCAVSMLPALLSGKALATATTGLPSIFAFCIIAVGTLATQTAVLLILNGKRFIKITKSKRALRIIL